MALEHSEPLPDAQILRVEDLSVAYDTDQGLIPALRSISLAVDRSSRVAIVGESGSGKSTLGLAISGFLNGPHVVAQAKRLEFDGRPIKPPMLQRLPSVPEGLSIVFQDAMTSLDPVWTIGSQMTAVLRRKGRLGSYAMRCEAARWLDRVGLGRDVSRVLSARPYELSGGMRQRAMLAIALCGSPKLLIADEPTSALDASLSREIMELLLELTQDLGTTLMIVSHDIFLCQQYADRIVVMKDGAIVDDGPAEKLEQTAKHSYTKGLLRCVPTLDTIDLDLLPTMERAHA
jgi:ABC-type glutathione transport system ATPase component